MSLVILATERNGHQLRHCQQDHGNGSRASTSKLDPAARRMARSAAAVAQNEQMSTTPSGRPSAGLAFEPILNGVDFLDRAINELLEAHDHRELKYAVLHLHAAAEILVKVRLQREGFEQVFEDPEQADEAKWKRGDFKSVTLTAALKRLDEVAEIKLESKERRALSNLGHERNKLQHFGSTSNHEVVINLAGKAMEVLSRFIIDYLVPEAPDDEQAPLAQAQELIRRTLREIASVARARLERIKPELDSWPGVVIHCPDCSELAWTFDLDSEDGTCRFCRTAWWQEHGWTVAELYVENVLGESRHLAAQGKSGWSIGMCPKCDEEALVDVATRANPDVLATVCFQCGFITTDELGSCMDCGRATLDPDFFLCPSCLAYKIAKD